MGFWIFMFCSDLLVPVVMLAGSWWFLKKPPRQINRFYGYRTMRSMRNQDTWDFAHRCCGALWQRLGWAVLVVSAGVMLPLMGKGDGVISAVGLILCIAQCVVLMVSVCLVERAMAREFD